MKRIEALFLFHGSGRIDYTLRGPDGKLIQEDIEPVVNAAASENQIRQRWWEAFSRVPDGASAAERELHDALLEILARCHGLSLPNRKTSNLGLREKPSQGLEAQFERAVGMLFGIESVKLAIQDDVTLRASTLKESANRPVSKPPRMTSLEVPAYQPVPIERIAMRVPAECFYLRTGNFSNYSYFRDFLVGWGGSLDDIVSPRTFDYDVRRKIETQLGFDTTTMKASEWDGLVSDLALIGCDSLFHDGAAVGVLLESDVPQALINKIQQQRVRLREQHPDTDERRVTIRNRWVSIFSTPDHRIRSFYAIDGPYHFITNSEHLLERFLETAGGDRSLGQLNEFGYAKSKANTDGSTRAVLYLSDPFFQNLISPHYRIEMTRRSVAKRALQQLQLARLVAEAEKIPAQSVRDMVTANLLPRDFAERADGSSATYRDGRYLDTVRGSRGTFLPVPDVPTQKATWTEFSGYERFKSDYNREWGRIDPVTVVFSGDAHPQQDGSERIGLDIIVAPYARLRYALLDTHLADANPMQLTPVAGDLISVQAAVRLGRSAPAHLLSIGLQDDDVPFVLQWGDVKRLGEKPDASFAKTRCYAAISPPNADVLRMLASVLLEGKSPTPTQTPTQTRRTTKLVPLPPSTPAPIKAIYYTTWALSNMPPGAAGAMKYLSMIETHDDVTVVSENAEIRTHVHDNINKQAVPDPHEVKLKITSLEQSKVEPYIQAYTYVEARRRSTENVQLLNRWTDWLRLPSNQSRNAVETLLCARVCCPLGGEFVISPANDHADWTSTAWTKPTRFEVTEIPPDWKFPFLHWLQGLAVNFDLEQSTLTARVDLTTRSHNGHNGVRNDQDPLLGSEPIATDVDTNLAEISQGDATLPESFNNQQTGEWNLGLRVSQNGNEITVSSVDPSSPAADIGIHPGDVIQTVNGETPKSSDDLSQRIRQAQQHGFVWIELNRSGSKIRMRVPL